LNNVLTENGNKVKVYNSISRDIIENMKYITFDIDNDNIKTLQEYIIESYNQLNDEIKNLEGYEYVIIDRTYYDILVYSLIGVNKKNWNDLLLKIDEPVYDYLVYNTPLDYKEDGIRNKINYREYGEVEIYEKIIKDVCNIIVDGSVDERINTILENILPEHIINSRLYEIFNTNINISDTSQITKIINNMKDIFIDKHLGRFNENGDISIYLNGEDFIITCSYIQLQDGYYQNILQIFTEGKYLNIMVNGVIIKKQLTNNQKSNLYKELEDVSNLQYL